MSIRLMTAAWQTDLPALEKLILLALADHANEDGEAWPSIATLSRRTGLAERTVQRNLRELELKGYLSISEARGRSNRYNLHPRQRDTLTIIEPSEEPSGEPLHIFARADGERVQTPPRAKKIPMPADWQPGPLPADLEELVAQWPEGRVERELAEFKEYWAEDGGKRPGWDRTWRSRIRTIHDRIMRESRNWQTAGPDRRDGFTRALDRMLGWDDRRTPFQRACDEDLRQFHAIESSNDLPID